MYKLDRKELVYRVVRLANLPPGNGTGGYLTRFQLTELVLYLEGTQELIKKLKEGNKASNDNKET